MRRAEDPSGLEEEQGTGDVHASRQAKHSRRHRGASRNHQMDMDLSQVQPSIKSNAPENGETRRRHGDVVHGGQPKMNDKHGERLTNASGRAVVVLREGRNDVGTSYGDSKNLTEEKVSKQMMTHRTSSRKQGGDHVPVAQLPMRSRTRNEYPSGPQMAVPSSQPQLSRGSSDPMYGGPRGRPGDARYGGQMKRNDKGSRMTKEVVNERWMACCTPSLTNITGNSPVSQQPTHSKTRNEYPYDSQAAIDLHHRGLVSRACTQCIKGSRGGSCTQRDRGVANKRHSKPNVKQKEKLTSLSVSVQEQSTVTYSSGRKPKVPDKHARHVDNKYNPEAHNAPQPTERDCVEQSLNQQDAFGCQRSLCDSCHTSHDTTRERVAEGGGMEYMHPTHPTPHTHGPYWDQDSADSLLSESEVVNEEFGTRHGVSDEPDEQSECSENSANTLNEIYGSSVHSDQQSEAVHMACIQEVHHYWVDRESDGGEPHPKYEDVDEDYMPRDVSASPMLFEDRDGQLWSYEDEIIPCNNAQEYGWNCESPVERHWVESEVPEWVWDPDERESSSKHDGEDDDQEDEPMDESDNQENEPTDESDEPTDESDEY
jgi:hypothetical protein